MSFLLLHFSPKSPELAIVVGQGNEDDLKQKLDECLDQVSPNNEGK